MHRNSQNPSRSSKAAYVLAFAALMLSGCGERDPGPIADLETRGRVLIARSINERWFEVTESADAGQNWTLLDPERYGSSDPADPSFSFDAPVIELTQQFSLCDGGRCWRANEFGISASQDGGRTWQQAFRVPEGRERFSPDGYPTIVDMVLTRSDGQNVVAAATAEDGLIVGMPDGTWERQPIDHWEAPDLTGNWISVWPEITGIVVATAVVFALLLLLINTLTRRAHEQLGQSFLTLIAVALTVPIAYYSIVPIIDWSNNEIVARADAIDQAVSAGLLWAALAIAVVGLLGLALRYRWSRKLSSLPFHDTPA